MTLHRLRMRAPANLTAVFLAVAGVSVFALVWLGIGIVRQDRALEAQRLAERREGAADRVVAGLERVSSVEERLLDGAAAPPEGFGRDGALLIVADSSGLQAWPDRALLYYPTVRPLREAPVEVFREAETLEHSDRAYDRAITLLRQLSKSRDPAVKAGAELRLARNLRKAGRAEAALETYSDLATVIDASLSGVPADSGGEPGALCAARGTGAHRASAQGGAGACRGPAGWAVATRSRGVAPLHRADRTMARNRSRERCRAADDCRGRRLGVAAMARGPDCRAPFVGPPRTRDRGHAGHGPVARVRRSPVALVASARYQQRRWFEPTLAALDRPSVGIALVGEGAHVLHGAAPAAGSPETRRLASATGLPWNVVATSDNLDADLRGFAQRRRLIVAGLGALALLVVAVSYLIGRAVSRELAAARLQSDFVSAVSHEFRTPLTALAQFTEILGEQEDAPIEKRRTFHEAQARSTRRLTRLVESLLDFGRMEAGARPYKLEPIDAAEMTEDVVRDFRQDVEPAGFTVSYNGPTGRATVNADREALTQAIWNLLDNAVKYSGDSRAVHVEVEQTGEVMIRVHDEGFGIPAPELKRIFRKFSRGSAATEHGVKGTGIGLAMVKHIVDAHAGRVAVDSEPGRGSTFTITVPSGG